MARVFRRTDKGDDYWWIDYRDEQGHRRQLKVSPNKRDAEKKLALVLADVAKRKHLPELMVGEILFREMVEQYLSTTATTLRWKGRVDGVLGRMVERWGKLRLRDLTPRHFEEYRSVRLRTVKPATANREIAIVKRVFNIAIDWGLTEVNPVRRVKMLQERNERRRFLTEEEIRRLLDSAAGHLRPLLIVALNTGARRGELLGLRWQDIDFKSRTLSFPNTKSGKHRSIRMNHIVVETLTALGREDARVFVYRGKGMEWIDQSFRSACKAAGIEDFRFHDLRHTWASHAVMKGIDIRTVQQILGHSTLAMTQRYAHLSPEHAMKAVDTVVLGKQPDQVKDRIVSFGLGSRRR